MDAFDALGLPPGQYTEEEIRSAYLRKARETHPDRGGRRAEWDAVEQAYRYLLDAAPSWTGGSVPERAAQRAWLSWLSVPRRMRVAAVVTAWTSIGTPVAWWVWDVSVSAGLPWQVPASLVVYAAGWGLWYIGREIPRPRWYWALARRRWRGRGSQ